MSFPFFFLWFTSCTWNQKNKTPKKLMQNTGRKEEEFDFSRNTFISCTAEKASVSTSFMKTGSVTVEAIICVPIFLYAAIALIWLLEIRTIQTTIRSGMHAAGKQMAEDVAYYSILWEEHFENDLIECIGKERLEQSFILGGVAGIDCNKSYSVPGSGIYDLTAKFSVKLPIPYFVSYGIKCEESMRIKGWNGYKKELFPDISTDKVVYVTETGVVYHLDYHCTYLEPSVRSVDFNGILAIRNQNGGKYYQCPLCTKEKDSYEKVYITDYGNRYHGNVGCPGIQRYVKEVLLSEIKGKVACSKCGR